MKHRRLKASKVKELRALLNLAIDKGAATVDDLYRNVAGYYSTLAGGAG